MNSLLYIGRKGATNRPPFPCLTGHMWFCLHLDNFVYSCWDWDAYVEIILLIRVVLNSKTDHLSCNWLGMRAFVYTKRILPTLKSPVHLATRHSYPSRPSFPCLTGHVWCCLHLDDFGTLGWKALLKDHLYCIWQGMCDFVYAEIILSILRWFCLH